MTATIGLDELNRQSALLNRVDRKYLIAAREVPMILHRLEGCAKVLEINGLSWFGYQVKTRGPRRTTVKDRLARADDAAQLTSSELRWISEILAYRGVRNAPVDGLQPLLTTRYSRRTLQLGTIAGDFSRLTIDVGLSCSVPGDDAADSASLDEFAIVETKGSPHPSAADRLLWRLGHRPLRISKYGIGMALINPQLPDYKWHRIITHQLAA